MDKWSNIVVNVQQQAAAAQAEQFTMSGNSIVEKVRPSAEGLGDNKLSSRDCDLLLGIFNPDKYGIEEYKDYDLTRIGKNYRELSILLNRNGISSANIGLYFNGACNYFKELPRASEMTEDLYRMIESKR